MKREALNIYPRVSCSVSSSIQKERLRQIRREKELEDYEDDHMGEYVRIFPTTDWARAKIYDGLMQTASKISLLGKSIARGSCPRRTSVCPSVLKLKVSICLLYSDIHNLIMILNVHTGCMELIVLLYMHGTVVKYMSTILIQLSVTMHDVMICVSD